MFLLEGRSGFERLLLREKQTVLINESEWNIKEWYFELGSKDLLLRTYKEFRNLFIEYVSDQGIDNIKKYTEEKWSDYISRLRDAAILKGMSEGRVLEKLRRAPAPRDFQVLFYTSNMYTSIIDVIRVWEIVIHEKSKFAQQRNKTKSNDMKLSQVSTKPVIYCYNCKQPGHIRPKCPHPKKQVNMANKGVENSDIKKEEVRLNKLPYSA